MKKSEDRSLKSEEGFLFGLQASDFSLQKLSAKVVVRKKIKI